MRHGSLFSGIGGFDLAAEWCGWKNIFHCEWNEFGQKILKHYWPEAISYDDITKTDFTIHRGTIDILTGGFPCQPYSAAGKRLGKDDERHLWPEMLRAIKEIEPRWIVGENVHGLVNWNGGMVFEEVQADLEAEGYEVQPYILPAAAVNAPHRRDRVWFVAYCSGKRSKEWQYGRGKNRPEETPRVDNRLKRPGCNGSTPKATSTDMALTPHAERNGLCNHAEPEGQQPGTGRPARCGSSTFVNSRDVADTGYTGLQRRTVRGILNGSGTQPYEQPAGFIRPTWEVFPTQSPICSRNDGLSPELDGITFPKWRNESIKAAGNAIVPQVAYQIFKTIELYERQRQQATPARFV